MPTQELTLSERASNALVAAGVMAKQEIQQEVEKFVPLTDVEVCDKSTRTEVHQNYMALRAIRLDIQKASKAAREDSVAFSKAVLAEEKELTALITPVEEKLKANRDKYDEKIKAEKQAAKERVHNLEKAVAAISATPQQGIGKSSSEINELIKELRAREVTEAEFAEYLAPATSAKESAIQQLSDMYSDAVAAEEREAELEALRQQAAEAQRLKEEQAAEIKRQQEEIERQQREAEAAKVKAAEAKAAEERRIAAEEQRRIEAEERRKAQAEAARLAEEKKKAEAEAARLAKEKEEAEAEAARIAEEAEAARLAEEKRLALEASRPDREKLAKFASDIAQFARDSMPELSGDERAVAAWMLGQIEALTEQVKSKVAE
ncbi:MAG: hypothetical protein CSB47_10415 [Proteobacteria bacterium]|nr:MAG: hypothetical protein CSB47_10415 [Pseudomonadota bacterium]